LGTSHRFRHIAKETEVESDSAEEEGEEEGDEEGDEAEGFFAGLDEELKIKDGTVEVDESSGDGERKKRKRAEDFGKSSRCRHISDSG